MSTVTEVSPPTPAPTQPSPMARFHALPAWLRYMVYAAIGIFVLAAVESLESGGVGRLTSAAAASAMLRWSIPILLAGLGGLFAERAGVVNIGLEGMMMLGTWFGAWGTLEFGPWVGMLIGLLGGAVGGLLHAIATVSFGVDHIISGVAINILALPAARFLSTEVFDNPTQSPDVDGLGHFTMPVLAGGGFFGADTPNALRDIENRDIFFISDLAAFARGLISGLSLFTLIALALVPVSAWVLWKTRFGLRLRIAGENPYAGESLGVNIYLQKYVGVIISGALAGLVGEARDQGGGMQGQRRVVQVRDEQPHGEDGEGHAREDRERRHGLVGAHRPEHDEAVDVQPHERAEGDLLDGVAQPLPQQPRRVLHARLHRGEDGDGERHAGDGEGGAGDGGEQGPGALGVRRHQRRRGGLRHQVAERQRIPESAEGIGGRLFEKRFEKVRNPREHFLVLRIRLGVFRAELAYLAAVEFLVAAHHQVSAVEERREG